MFVIQEQILAWFKCNGFFFGKYEGGGGSLDCDEKGYASFREAIRKQNVSNGGVSGQKSIKRACCGNFWNIFQACCERRSFKAGGQA